MLDLAPPPKRLEASVLAERLPLEAGGDGASLEPACLNCGSLRLGDFCQACGQSGAVQRPVTFRALWTDFRRRQLNLDRGLLLTLVDVLVHPGRVARAFVEGQRQRYAHPISLLFLVYGVYVLAFKVFDAQLQHMLEAQFAVRPNADTPEMQAAVRIMMPAMRFLSTYGAYFSVLFIFPFALALRRLSKDRSRTLAEYVVFGLTIDAATTLWSALVLVPISVWAQTQWVTAISYILYPLYAVVGARAFLDRRPGTTRVVLATAVGLGAYMTVLMVAALVVGIVIGFQSAGT